MRIYKRQLLGVLMLGLLWYGCGEGSGIPADPELGNGGHESGAPSYEEGGDGGSSSASGGGTTAPTGNGTFRLLAWNDLGMHCMDGSDYSVFSILPPYNNLIAQLVEKGDGTARRISQGVTITYQAVPSLKGKWNTSSANKTNFWNYAKLLFKANLQKDIGLTGNPVASKTPAPMRYEAANDWWKAEAIPMMPRNDDGTTNHYPMVKVVAKDLQGKVLAQTITVLPVSDEMDCRKCHGSNAGYTATRPTNGFVNDPDPNKDYKYNILRLHDQKHDISSYLADLKNRGYSYQASLEQTARSGTPILCAACHRTNALGTQGFSGIDSLSSAIHSRHAHVIDPTSSQPLSNSNNRDACYACHPGQTTQCLRGAMGKAKNSDGSSKMQCQSCHGSMSAVGSAQRTDWLDEPKCQNCHQEGKRYTTAVTDAVSGTLRAALDTRFATTPDRPIGGKSLYRFSTGHGKLQCAACHGATHAIYESARAEDNKESIMAQGHAGTIAECTVCHTTPPRTTSGGPHGMHTAGVSWISDHKSVAEHQGTASCAKCHGADYRGSPLSKMFSDRSREFGRSQFTKGHQVSCYDCHNGPGGGD